MTSVKISSTEVTRFNNRNGNVIVKKILAIDVIFHKASLCE